MKKRTLTQEREIPMTFEGRKLKISSKIASDLLNSILAEFEVSRTLPNIVGMTAFLFTYGGQYYKAFLSVIYGFS